MKPGRVPSSAGAICSNAGWTNASFVRPTDRHSLARGALLSPLPCNPSRFGDFSTNLSWINQGHPEVTKGHHSDGSSMQQINYRPVSSSHTLGNPLLQTVARSIAQIMPISNCEDWPQPLLELLARLEDPHSEEVMRPPLVIVVGPCPTMTEQAATLLRASALEVICCDGGEQAISVLKQRGGDVALVVADQDLEGSMDGFSLSRALGLLWPGIPVILATRRSDRGPLPIAVTPLDRPWLPLSLLIQTHRALGEPPPLAH